MKHTFAIALVAALATAQDYYYYQNGTDFGGADGNDTTPLDGMFELNEEGMWELNVPHLPEISFTDVDDQIIIDWANGRKGEYDEVNQGYADAWDAYMNSVMGPWNDLVSDIKSLEVEITELDLQTSEDVINFVADNTFIDGTSLRDTYPEIDQLIEQMRNQTAAYEEQVMNWDELYLTPVTLQSYYNDYDYTEEETYEEPRINFGEMIRETLLENGFDQAVVEQWLSDSSVALDQLNREHQQAELQLAQAQIAEANDYVKSFLDNLVANLRQKQAVNQAEFEAALDAKLDEMKAQMDAEALEAIDQLASWVDSNHAQVEEATQADIAALIEEAIQEAQEPAEVEASEIVLLADAPVAEAQPSNNNLVYGCGALALGALLTMGYLHSKKNKEVKFAMPDAEEKFVDDDEQYCQA